MHRAFEKRECGSGVINIPEKLNYGNIIVKTPKVRDVFIANRNFKELKGRKVSLKELEKYPSLYWKTLRPENS